MQTHSSLNAQPHTVHNTTNHTELLLNLLNGATQQANYYAEQVRLLAIELEKAKKRPVAEPAKAPEDLTELLNYIRTSIEGSDLTFVNRMTKLAVSFNSMDGTFSPTGFTLQFQNVDVQMGLQFTPEANDMVRVNVIFAGYPINIHAITCKETEEGTADFKWLNGLCVNSANSDIMHSVVSRFAVNVHKADDTFIDQCAKLLPPTKHVLENLKKKFGDDLVILAGHNVN